MSSDDTAISVRDVSKHYLLFAKPEDRLKQSIMPRLQRLVRRQPKQYYRDFAALHRVSFDVKRGDTVGIIGRNGCGKSTLLQIVCGILQPSSGTVSVNGRIAALLELGSGFNRDFSGRENVYMNGAILGLSRAEISARFEAIARFADIGDFLEQPVKTYSSGMQVRLAFATAINVDPDILVVDEALAVGDEAFKRKCYARLEEIQNKGGTILFVSHSAQAIVQLCSRAILIDGGELLLLGAPKTVVSQYQRLVNASPAGAQDIRAAIMAMRDAPPLDEPTRLVAGDTPEAAMVAEQPRAPPAEALNSAARAAGAVHELTRLAVAPAINDAALADYYDPNLVSKSTVYLEERGARIRKARITTLSDRPVNIIRLGHRYRVSYEVVFEQDSTDVTYGFAFRLANGAMIAGAHTNQLRGNSISNVPAGKCLMVSFEFSSLLLPNTYFLGCGVLGTVAGEPVVLHRIIDAAIFKVAPEPEVVATGYFDLSVMPHWSIVDVPPC